MPLAIKQWFWRARLQLRRVRDSISILVSENPRPRRPLTPLNHGPKTQPRRRKYHPQNQALFFKLPVEIRQVIYKHIYGVTIIHTRGPWGRSGSRLALLKTCRKIYTEAIEVLYNFSSLAYYSSRGLFYTPFCRHPTRKANFQSFHINVEFSLLCCQWCDRLDLFDTLCWEMFAQELPTYMPGTRNLSITMVNKSPQIAFHGTKLDDPFFAQLLNRFVVPQWHLLGFLEKFEVEVNWEMERPQEAALTAFKVVKD